MFLLARWAHANIGCMLIVFHLALMLDATSTTLEINSSSVSAGMFRSGETICICGRGSCIPVRDLDTSDVEGHVQKRP